MSLLTGQETKFEGHYGQAERVPMPDIPSAAETVCVWIMTHPQGHPFWSQYYLGVVRLRANIPGFPEPQLQFPEATHELFVVAMDPEEGPYTPENITKYYGSGRLPYLLPVNIAEQVQATDEEASLLAVYAARAVTVGHLWPETADAPDRVHYQWHSALHATLEHMRTGQHG